MSTIKRIYIDFDDCLCETARHFSGFVKDLFGKNVPYEKIRYFDLQKSFSLTDEQFEEMKIMVYDRPWNQECEFPGEYYRRCFDWKMIDEMVRLGES